MNIARFVIIAFHKKHKGNWDKIYYDFMNKTPLTDEEFEIGKKYADKYITIVDSNYPYERMKHKDKPPFVIRCHHKENRDE